MNLAQVGETQKIVVKCPVHDRGIAQKMVLGPEWILVSLIQFWPKMTSIVR